MCSGLPLSALGRRSGTTGRAIRLVGAVTRRSRGFCPVAPVGIGVGRPHFVVRTRIIRIIHISRNDCRSGLLNLRRGTRTEREVCPGADHQYQRNRKHRSCEDLRPGCSGCSVRCLGTAACSLRGGTGVHPLINRLAYLLICICHMAAFLSTTTECAHRKPTTCRRRTDNADNPGGRHGPFHD